MKFTRREFITGTARVGALSLVEPASAAPNRVPDRVLEEAASKPVFSARGLKEPVIIESIELLRKGKEHFVRVRSKDGAEGISVDDGRMDVLHPILKRLVAPYFIGKDAR